MKRILTALMLIGACVMLVGCDNDKTINGKHYDVYGLANKEANQDPDIVYELSAGSVICAIIFSETVIVPIYVIGWDLWQPVKARKPLAKATE